MGCNRVVITKTSSSGGNSSVNWRTPSVTGLVKFLITIGQSGEVKNFEADASATSATVAYTAAEGCTVTVTPTDATGPRNDMSSAPAPFPFPPTPTDPDAGRPITVRVCADSTAGTVTVDWLSSTIQYLEGYVLTIIEGTAGLTNFDAPGAATVSATVTYAVDSSKQYSVIVTPYDDLSPVKESAAYPVALPYPAAPTLGQQAYLADSQLLPLRSKIRRGSTPS